MPSKGDSLAACGGGRVFRQFVNVARLAGAMAVSLFLAACSRETVQPMRIAMNVWPGYEPLFLARHDGRLPESDYRLVEFSNAAEVGRAFRNGSVEAACLTLDEVFYLVQAGADPVIVLVMDDSNGGDAVLARPGIRSLADLRGRRVGVEVNAVETYTLTRALQQAGLELKDVVVVQLPNEKHISAFQSGEIDAVVTFEPVRSRLLALGAVDIFNSKQIPGEIVDVLVVQRAYVQAHPERIAGLRRIWFEALTRIVSAPRETAAIMARRQQMSPESFLGALSGLHFPDRDDNRALLSGPAPQLLAPAKKLKTVMRDAGLLSADVPLETLFAGSTWDTPVATEPHK